MNFVSVSVIKISWMLGVSAVLSYHFSQLLCPTEGERQCRVIGAEELLSAGGNIPVSWDRYKEHSDSPDWKGTLAQTRAQMDAWRTES